MNTSRQRRRQPHAASDSDRPEHFETPSSIRRDAAHPACLDGMKHQHRQQRADWIDDRSLPAENRPHLPHRPHVPQQRPNDRRPRHHQHRPQQNRQRPVHADHPMPRPQMRSARSPARRRSPGFARRNLIPSGRPARNPNPPSKRISPTESETAGSSSCPSSASGFNHPRTGPAMMPVNSSSRMEGRCIRQASHCAPMPKRRAKA